MTAEERGEQLAFILDAEGLSPASMADAPRVKALLAGAIRQAEIEAALQEREACARLAEAIKPHEEELWFRACEEVAAAIRARGNA